MDFGELILDDGFASDRPRRTESDIRKDFQEVQRVRQYFIPESYSRDSL